MHRLKNLNHESAEILILAVILIAFIAVLSILNPGFLTFNTWESISFQFPELGVLTIGMAVTMLVGGINLSCIASANLSAIIMVTIMAALIPEGQDSKTAVFIAVVAGVLASVVIGILNGVIIAFFESGYHKRRYSLGIVPDLQAIWQRHASWNTYPSADFRSMRCHSCHRAE